MSDSGRVHFPFVAGGRYSLSLLREFEKNLSEVRKRNPVFSSRLRSNDPDIRWAKFRNEELGPFLLLADALRLSDGTSFEVCRSQDPGPDLLLHLGDMSVGIQVTIADPDWNGDGGKTYRLEAEVLGRGDVAWGGGGTSKRSFRAPIESNPRVVTYDERLLPCRSALKKALQRKCDKVARGNWLLVYARGFWLQTIDCGFASFVELAIGELVADFEVPDEKIYVVDTCSRGPVLAEWRKAPLFELEAGPHR